MRVYDATPFLSFARAHVHVAVADDVVILWLLFVFAWHIKNVKLGHIVLPVGLCDSSELKNFAALELCTLIMLHWGRVSTSRCILQAAVVASGTALA